MTTLTPPSENDRLPLSVYREAAALYYEAHRYFDTGDLEKCRDDLERALLVIVRPASRPSASDTAVVEDDTTATTELVDTLFANVLILLSQVYSGAWAYHEADRLLATAGGYIEERLPSPALAMAAVHYNRAVLRLEQSRLNASVAGTPPSAADMALVCEAQDAYLEPAAAYLADVVGPSRALLSDVLHCLGTCCVLRAEYVHAMQHYQRSLDVRIRSYAALERELHKQLGDLASDESVEESLRTLRPLLPRQDVTELKLALTLAHLAQLYRLIPDDRAAQRQALRCLTRAVETRRRWLGPRHALVLDACAELAVVAAEAGEVGVARTALHDIIDQSMEADTVRRDSAVAFLAQLV